MTAACPASINAHTIWTRNPNFYDLETIFCHSCDMTNVTNDKGKGKRYQLLFHGNQERLMERSLYRPLLTELYSSLEFRD
jgi:hypothetical protein